MSIKAVLDAMPYRLRNRFDSLSGYVTGCIEQAIEDLRRQRGPGRRVRLPGPGDRQLIQMVVFVVGISRFFRDGTRAAALATDACASLDTPGFSVGATVFEGRNENVMMGQRLRDGLLAALGNSEVAEWADSRIPLGEIVTLLVTRCADGRRLF